jgi:hypothetical protein
MSFGAAFGPPLALAGSVAAPDADADAAAGVVGGDSLIAGETRGRETKAVSLAEQQGETEALGGQREKKSKGQSVTR